jgi:hypothetical protein
MIRRLLNYQVYTKSYVFWPKHGDMVYKVKNKVLNINALMVTGVTMI